MTSNNNSNSNDDSYNENTCVVCFKNVDIFSIGDCDHPVCYECSTRMRVLCRQNECPICRHDMQKVIFTKSIQPFKKLNAQIGTRYLKDQKFKIVFENTDVQRAYDTLLAHVCSKCTGRHAFQTFAHLRDHMRKEHELFYCELCVENLKILTHERRCYTRKELATHRRQGDLDNRSHRGHPLCEFCDNRYMDNDELYRHLRRDHLFCHFCDIDGLHQYYNSYDVLREHFRDRHYLCEEGECYHEKFTSAFRTEIDLKAHRASVHGRQMTKAAAKQARTLELAFTIKPRPCQSDTRRGGGGGRNNARYASYSDEEEGAVGGMAQHQRQAQHQRPAQMAMSTPTFNKINTASNDEFPSLGGSSAPLAQGMHFRKPGVTIRAGGSLAMTEEDFPALGPDAPATASLSLRSKGPGNVSIHVNTRPSSVVTTVTSSKGGRKDPFPALRSAPTPAAVQAPQWSEPRLHARTKPNQPSAKPSQLSAKPSQLSAKPSQSKNAKSFHLDDEDFPVHNNISGLRGNVPSHIASLASSQWSSGLQPEAKVSVNKSKPNQPPPKPPQPKTFHIEDDFPSLSTKFNASCNVAQKSKHSSSKSHDTKLKKESSISISVDNDWAKQVKDTASNDVSSDSDIGSKKSSKKNKKKSSAKSESTNQPSKSNQGKNTNTNTNNNNNNEVPKKNKDSKMKTKQNKVEEQSASQTMVSNSVDEQKTKEPVERKRSELKIEGLNGQQNAESVVNMNDFPSLSNSRLPPGFTKEKTPAPPGFDTSPAPPPGFSIKLNSVARPPSNGLTFTSSSGQNYPISPVESGGRVYSYVPPPGCKTRNTDLVQRVAEALVGPDHMDQFLTWSAEFRCGALTGDGYYHNCRQLMGHDTFYTLFPELIVLLPDINKQQELWKVSEQRGEWRLTVCAACGQVLAAADFKSHHSTHSLDNHFPSLPNGLTGPNAWNN